VLSDASDEKERGREEFESNNLKAQMIGISRQLSALVVIRPVTNDTNDTNDISMDRYIGCYVGMT
jgi:hypothetical protein